MLDEVMKRPHGRLRRAFRRLGVGSVNVGQVAKGKRRQRGLQRSQWQAACSDDRLEKKADHFVAKVIERSESCEFDGCGALTHPFSRLAAEIDVIAGVIAFPGVTMDGAGNVYLHGRGI